MGRPIEYTARPFDSVRGLEGIPDAVIEAHLKLYQGYVTNLNKIRARLPENETGSTEWSELQRRVGFEVNGMRLHELYFENLVAKGNAPGSSLKAAFEPWGSFDAWRAEFAAMGVMRGVGWVVLYRDPVKGVLSNHWIGLHEEGHPAGFTPILVMDVWEHAFSGIARPKYVEAFLANADWSVAEKRLTAASR